MKNIRPSTFVRQAQRIQGFLLSAMTYALVTLSSCNSEPPVIVFGKDYCEFCKMTIMDKKFGAEMMNKKGKAIKFDSGECMVGYINADKDFDAYKTLIVNYSNPGELIDAEKSFFLHGGDVNSPMGGQLAAFKTREDAEKIQKELQGEIVLWDKVVTIHF